MNMNTNINSINKCRFCYNYKPSKPVEQCCNPQICATNEFLASVSSLTEVINNNSRTSERSLLISKQQEYLLEQNNQVIASTYSTTLQNSTIIANNIYSQLLGIREQRYQPYQPYIYPTIPSSVVQLQMNTMNTGVPFSFFTIMDCKGSQSVTT